MEPNNWTEDNTMEREFSPSDMHSLDTVRQVSHMRQPSRLTDKLSNMDIDQVKAYQTTLRKIEAIWSNHRQTYPDHFFDVDQINLNHLCATEDVLAERQSRTRRRVSPKQSNLSQKQRKILQYIHRYKTTFNASPSFEQIRENVIHKGKPLTSLSVVSYNLDRLEELGYIHRLPNKARSIIILKMPDGEEAVA